MFGFGPSCGKMVLFLWFKPQKLGRFVVKNSNQLLTLFVVNRPFLVTLFDPSTRSEVRGRGGRGKLKGLGSYASGTGLRGAWWKRSLQWACGTWATPCLRRCFSELRRCSTWVWLKIKGAGVTQVLVFVSIYRGAILGTSVEPLPFGSVLFLRLGYNSCHYPQITIPRGNIQSPYNHLLKKMFDFALPVLQGIDFTTGRIFIFPGGETANGRHFDLPRDWIVDPSYVAFSLGGFIFAFFVG